MTKRMLIDATHAEETRVVVLDGSRLEDFDVETSTKKQLKGNIYLAKVVRVEPSLQAAFVEYGGGRHGFLAFGEIHPDYYQIPVADRQRLLRMQAEEARAAEEEDDLDDRPAARPAAPAEDFLPAPEQAAPGEADEPVAEARAEALPEGPTVEAPPPEAPPVEAAPSEPAGEAIDVGEPHRPAQPALIAQDVKFGEETFAAVGFGDIARGEAEPLPAEAEPSPAEAAEFDADLDIPAPEPPPETIGGDSDVFEGNGAEEARARRSSRLLRNYRIQEVIHRRQIMLIQVVKEERGTKGAALTTYISLAGRFCVLMPNSPRGGGISRKITSAADRRRLKEITAELEIPQGMGLIVRTAGAARPKPEIRRDCEYLMRLWDDIREHTMRSVAPALIYEEASLIKRTIRDVYSRDVEDVLVDGEDGWKAAHDFMRMLMPSHAKKVQLWRPSDQRGGGQPLFSANGVEAQLDAMLSPNVQLRSGGYLVINQAEALVAIDVNSGRSTRERGIEETALRTNLEAADEVARQLRLRDLAGLIVIDFIDMEAKKHNAMVERRLKEALKNDRARIQVGHISHFGLLEMSRQRLRPSLSETNFVTCAHCAGLGLVRSTESSAIHVLRGIEEEGAKGRASLVMVHAAGAIVMYLLNNKRDRLAEIEARTAMRVHFTADDSLVPPEIRIDRLKPAVPEAERAASLPVAPLAPLLDAPEDVEDEDVGETDRADAAEAAGLESAVLESAAPESAAPESADESERRHRRRRRRRTGRRDASEASPEDTQSATAEAADLSATTPAEPSDAVAEDAAADADADPTRTEQPSLDPTDLDENGLPRARRRGRRGGRRRRRDGTVEEAAGGVVETPPVPVYAGPTPADPFGGDTYDIFDMIDRAAEPEPGPPPAPTAAEPPLPELEPAPLPAPTAAEPPPPEPEPVAAPEPEPAPAIEALVVDQEPVPAPEPKRGWWRR